MLSLCKQEHDREIKRVAMMHDRINIADAKRKKTTFLGIHIAVLLFIHP